jgi:hypothetical protein
MAMNYELMKQAVLVTANFGGIDELKPLPPRHGMAAYCYVDAFKYEPHRATTSTWSQLIRSPGSVDIADPRVQGRYFKSQIHHLPEIRDARWLMWADASIRFSDLAFVGAALRQLSIQPEERRVLLVPHPQRSTIQDEHEFLKGQIAAGDPYLRTRYPPARLDQQMESAARDPRRLRLRQFAGGLWIVENSDRMKSVWDAWWEATRNPGSMDQLSLALVLDDHGIEPATWDLELLANPYFVVEPHGRLM